MKRVVLPLVAASVIFAAAGFAAPAKAQAAPGFFSFSVGGPGYYGSTAFGGVPPYGPYGYGVPFAPRPYIYGAYPYNPGPYPYGAYYGGFYGRPGYGHCGHGHGPRFW